MSRIRTKRLLLVIPISAALVCGGAGAATTTRTYVPNCGSTSYLQFKPRYWSSGCTGGALNMDHVRWGWWGERSARADGRALLRYESGTYRATAVLHLSRRHTCRDERGRFHHYFLLARFSVLYRRSNPFRYRAGWRTSRVVVRPDSGACALSR